MKKSRKGGNKEKAFILLKKAQDHELFITPILVLAAQVTNTSLVGLDYKIKSLESIESKLSKRSEMNDILRYTFIIPDGVEFTGKVKDLNDYLVANSIKLTKSKNYFCPENSYKGLNRFYTHEGYTFEIQFHTNQSFEVKMKTHKEYESFRISTDETAKCELSKEMMGVTNQITTRYEEEPCIQLNTYCQRAGRIRKTRKKFRGSRRRLERM